MPKRGQKKKSEAKIGNVVIVKPVNRVRTLGGGRHRSHNEQQQVQMCLRPYMRTFLQGADGIPNIYKSQSPRKQSARKAGNRSGTNHDSGEDEVQKECREPVRCRWHNRAVGASEERSQLKSALHARKQTATQQQTYA